MIKSLSPYYLTIPFVSPLTGATCTAYTLNIYIWEGVKFTPPTTVSYPVTKQNIASSTGTDKINIARLINDFIDFTPIQGTVTGLYDGQNQMWCKTEIIYTTDNVLDLNVVQLKSTMLVLKGYGYGMGGENQSTPANKILLQGNEFKVNRAGVFNLPILIDEPINNSSLVLDEVLFYNDITYSFLFTANFVFTQLYYQTRVNELGNWSSPVIFDGITSPQLGDYDLDGGFQSKIFAYNPLTGNTITSNIFTYV